MKKKGGFTKEEGSIDHCESLKIMQRKRYFPVVDRQASSAEEKELR